MTFNPYANNNLAIGQTTSPNNLQITDNQYNPLLLGRNGDLLISKLHGQKYNSRARGYGFSANFNGTAGVQLDVAGGTGGGANGMALLYNPVGSGVLVELEKIRLTTGSTATVVISGFGLEGSVQVPSSTTAATIVPYPLGSANGAGKALAYKAATITAMTYVCGLGLSATATTSMPGVCEVDFDGTLVMAPGYALNLVSTIDQATDGIGVDFFWSEWLP